MLCECIYLLKEAELEEDKYSFKIWGEWNINRLHYVNDTTRIAENQRSIKSIDKSEKAQWKERTKIKYKEY